MRNMESGLADPKIRDKAQEEFKINGVPLKTKDGLEEGTSGKEAIKNLEKALKEGVFANLETDGGNSSDIAPSR